MQKSHIDQHIPIVEVENLHIRYRRGGTPLFGRSERIAAVRGVSFQIHAGETFAIVGDSGSGKTSVAMSILGFTAPENGTIKFKGTDIWNVDNRTLRTLRRTIQPVFQNAHGSLSPRMRVGKAVEEGLPRDKIKDKSKKIKEVLDLFGAVGLSEEHLDRYPHQLSGGQKQRVCLARALAPQPELLILDEPLSAQDLSVQAHLLNLLLTLKQQRGLTYLLISHDLKIVRALAQRTAVMKEGAFVKELSNDLLTSSDIE